MNTNKERSMKILLVYPETPPTFWSFKKALSFIAKKAAEPPLGLLTVAGLLPEEWEKKLIDLNISHLSDEQILWADYVFLGGMSIQRRSFKEVTARCNRLGVRVVAGGPLCTMHHQELSGVDHFVLGEAEITLPPFLADLRRGEPRRVYSAEGFTPLAAVPLPRWELLEMDKYATIDIQYSRGCPFDCEFCSITTLYGHVPRTKATAQFLAELESLYAVGWRGAVFVVDDNFIGNRRKLKQDFLPALIDWSRKHGYPFGFNTEVSIDLADDQELVDLMVSAGFKMVFVGIETPDDRGLAECGKLQNRNRDLLQAVKMLQRSGLDVSGGFIVGFDSDGPDIFERQIRFIQKSGIVTAMVGLLNAPPGTRLFKRLQAENRIITTMSGDNMDGSLNFLPRMKPQLLMEGYRRILRTIYSQEQYFERIKTFLAEYRLPRIPSPHLQRGSIAALFRAVWHLGIWEEGKRYFWKLVFHVLRHHRRKFPQAIEMAIYGYHFRAITAAL
jgi:radical SAM superfamily enzyme YgiQ (UPF0313 family)